MDIVLTELEAYGHTRDSESLETLRSATGVRANLRADIPPIILDTGSWILTEKAAPYSDMDCMIIYGGENENVRALGDCTAKERQNLDMLLKKVVKGLEQEYANEISTGLYKLHIGINTAMVPGAGKAQSVYRPHIHITLFRTKPTIENHMRVTVGKVDDFLAKLSINDENKYLLDGFEDFLERHGKFGKTMKRPAIEYNQTYHALDFVLPDSSSLVGENNTKYMMVLYNLAETYSQHFGKSIDYEWGMAINDRGLQFRKDQMAYSLVSFQENGKTVIRLKFTYRKPNNTGEKELGASMEIAGFPVSRRIVEPPRLPDSRDFRRRVEKILGM